jgi:hypothetical protein
MPPSRTGFPAWSTRAGPSETCPESVGASNRVRELSATKTSRLGRNSSAMTLQSQDSRSVFSTQHSGAALWPCSLRLNPFPILATPVKSKAAFVTVYAESVPVDAHCDGIFFGMLEHIGLVLPLRHRARCLKRQFLEPCGIWSNGWSCPRAASGAIRKALTTRHPRRLILMPPAR